MPCSICKKVGHTKTTCPDSQQVGAVLGPIPEPPTGPKRRHIKISDSSALWTALSQQCYDNFQPINELVDNAIAAIIRGGGNGNIYITFDFATNTGSIEHSGGVTFPLTSEGLSACFTYGYKQTSSLNEHGCGLKSSLAILDPTNTIWKIWMKHDDNGVLSVLGVSAPYSDSMEIQDEEGWPGANKTIEAGTYITFPIKKDRFVDLYSSRDAKMSDVADLHNRIRCHFSHMWMKQEDVLSGRVRIHYNGAPVIPFSFSSHEVYDKYVESSKKLEFVISTGAKIYVEEIKLKRDAVKIPGSYKFKHAMTSNGVVLFKNGRWIEFINNDDPGRKLYSRILGSVPDNHHNGYIKVVNMVGTQEQLPPTVPTKNRFGIGPIFEELINGLRKHITPFPGNKHVSEDSVVIKYKETLQKALATLGLPQPPLLEQEKSYRLDGGITTPPIDLVKTFGDNIEIMEFKATHKPQVDHFAQLFVNWTFAKAANPGKSVSAVLLLLDSGDPVTISDAHKHYLMILNDAYGFNPIIRTVKNEQVWPTSH
jgi:hypothetical protein